MGKNYIKHYGEKAIYRKHDKTDVNIDFIKDEELKDFLKLRSMKKATYSYCNKDDKNYHYGLDSYNYTHFTSPIRRYADIISHKLLLNLILDCKYEIKCSEDILERMNLKDKNIKKAERMMKKIELIDSLEKKKIENDINTSAWIIKLYDYGLKIYIPEFGIEEKIYLTSNRFQEIQDLEKFDDKIVYIKKEEDRLIKKEYNLYEKIDIKIVPFLKSERFYHKIKIIL